MLLLPAVLDTPDHSLSTNSPLPECPAQPDVSRGGEHSRSVVGLLELSGNRKIDVTDAIVLILVLGKG